MSTTPVRKSMQNVFQVLCPTRNYGLGARVTRKVWAKFPEESYWEITRIHPSPDLKHGKVFGRFTFRGKSAAGLCALQYPQLGRLGCECPRERCLMFD